MSEPPRTANTSLRAWMARKPTSVTPGALVRVERLSAATALPVVVRPELPGVDLVAWAGRHREEIDGYLRATGGVLLRGFSMTTPAAFEAMIRACCGEPIEYTYKSTPRTRVEGRVYTSTEYPADQVIPLHNEMSYGRAWPLRIAFCCVQPAESDGQTPIADSRDVLRAIPADVREKFARLGVMYVRNYRSGLDLDWRDVFETGDRDVVGVECARRGIDVEWLSPDHLRTRQTCQGVATHPVTGERVWFNQAHLFHVSSLPPAVASLLLRDTAADLLPRNAFYGDGAPIEPEALNAVRAAFDRHTVRFDWERGDVLLLDNMLVAHGRRPFQGARRVLTAMAVPIDATGKGDHGTAGAAADTSGRPA